MKHFVILGKLQSKYDCPYFEDSNCTIISMNKHFDEDLLPRVDLWFDLHETPAKEDADYLKSNFPFESCHALVHGKRYVTTAAYLIAWAILQGAEKISLYGMRFSQDGNSRRERELHNVREMIYFCLGRGIELEINPNDVDFLFPEHIQIDGEDFDQ